MKKLLGFVFIFILFLSTVICLSLGVFSLRHPEVAIGFLQQLQPTPTITSLPLKGIGVIGDSLSDEYRADDRRGLTYGPTTLNWVEILAKNRHLNFGPWAYYEEPRREGYAYDFARTGENLSGALDAGQDTGLADEIRKGNVNTVIIYLGVNDFSPLSDNGYEAIYDGSMDDDQLRRKINTLTADMQTIIETLQSAGQVQILLVTIPDWGKNSLVKIAFPLPQQRERVSGAIDDANNKLTTLAQEKKVKVADINSFYDDLDKRDTGDALQVGNVRLNKYMPGDDPRDAFLDDGVHPGTIINGLFANFIIQSLNSQFGATINPFSDEEILSVAGIG